MNKSNDIIATESLRSINDINNDINKCMDTNKDFTLNLKYPSENLGYSRHDAARHELDKTIEFHMIKLCYEKRCTFMLGTLCKFFKKKSI